ncbi:MAG: fasciclin domain-containing protein, partial [Ilumatobacteraceae bacterium]
MNPTRSTRRHTPLRFVAVTMVAGLAFAACGSDKAANTTTPATTQSSASPSSMAPGTTGACGAMMGAFGSGCAAVPANGAGSFAGMADAPAATAA